MQPRAFLDQMQYRPASEGRRLSPSGSLGSPPRVTLLALVLLSVITVACGEQSRPTSRPTSIATSTCSVPAAEPTPHGPGTTLRRGAPRWETVTRVSGSGSAKLPAFQIRPDCIQWRARWNCATKRLRVTTDPAGRRPSALIDDACPGSGEAFAILPGQVSLGIETAGPWELAIDQQVDTPLLEPALKEMVGAPIIGKGRFYGLEEMASGFASLYKPAKGPLLLRIEGLAVSNNVDLDLWLSQAAGPKTSGEAAAAPYLLLGSLKSTLGDQNYVLPGELPAERLGSLVIWCEPRRIAYGAAALALPP